MHNVIDVIALLQTFRLSVLSVTLSLILLFTVADDLPDLNWFDSRLVKSVFFLLIVLENVFGLRQSFLFEGDIGAKELE